MTYKKFSEEKLAQAEQKKYWYKILLFKTLYGLEYEKTASVNYLLKYKKTLEQQRPMFTECFWVLRRW